MSFAAIAPAGGSWRSSATGGPTAGARGRWGGKTTAGRPSDVYSTPRPPATQPAGTRWHAPGFVWHARPGGTPRVFDGRGGKDGFLATPFAEPRGAPHAE